MSERFEESSSAAPKSNRIHEIFMSACKKVFAFRIFCILRQRCANGVQIKLHRFVAAAFCILDSRFSLYALSFFAFAWFYYEYAHIMRFSMVCLNCGSAAGLVSFNCLAKKSKKDITMTFQTCVPGLKSVNIVFSITRRL